MDLLPEYKNDAVLVRADGPVGVITLNRPDKGNLLLGSDHDEFEDTMWRLGRHENRLRVAIITGAGDYFCTRQGFDYPAFLAGLENSEWNSGIYNMTSYARRLVEAMLSVEIPIIAAINGDAVGLGSTIALLCDITVMDEQARIGDQHGDHGVVPGDGGQVMFPLLVGPSRAKDMLMRGTTIDGPEAERIGLVTHVSPPGQALQVARSIADELLTKPPLAVKWAKSAVNQQVALMFTLNMRLGLATEGLSYLSHDVRENVRAVIEERPADYRGT